MPDSPDTVKPAPGLRDRNKAKRRDAIMDSTCQLLGHTPIRNLTVEQIAAHAELAPATVYNLVGSRETLFAACVNRVLDGLVDHLLTVDTEADPIAAALDIVTISSEAFIEQGSAFRQIVGELNGLSRAGTGLAFDPGQLQIAAMSAAQRHGMLRADVDPAAVGRQVFLSFTGALHAWSAGQLTDEGLRAGVRYGLWSAIAAAASEEDRPRFVHELVTASVGVAEAGYGQRQLF